MMSPNHPAGTDCGLTAPVDESRAIEIADAVRRLELVALLGEVGRFDFDLILKAWGGDDQPRNNIVASVVV